MYCPAVHKPSDIDAKYPNLAHLWLPLQRDEEHRMPGIISRLPTEKLEGIQIARSIRMKQEIIVTQHVDDAGYAFETREKQVVDVKISEADAIALSAAISVNKGIKNMILESIRVDGSYKIWYKIMLTNMCLDRLSLATDEISTRDANLISAYIRSTKTLTTFTLGFTSITPEGVSFVAEAMGRNATIILFMLRSGGLTDSCVAKLCTQLTRNYALEKLYIDGGGSKTDLTEKSVIPFLNLALLSPCIKIMAYTTSMDGKMIDIIVNNPKYAACLKRVHLIGGCVLASWKKLTDEHRAIIAERERLFFSIDKVDINKDSAMMFDGDIYWPRCSDRDNIRINGITFDTNMAYRVISRFPKTQKLTILNCDMNKTNLFPML